MTYSFADFTLDPLRRELRRGGEPIGLQPKNFDALALLLRERHRVVAREEMLAEVWPDETVSFPSLNVCINGVRKALGDSGDDQGFIRTYRGRGYRFVGAVTQHGAAEDEDEPHAPQARPFVGRQDEMGRLQTALDRAVLQRRPRLLLVTGEAGIGKTTLADQLVQHARRRKVLVLVGRCLEGAGALPFRPWAQILADYAGQTDAKVLASTLGSAVGDLSQISPELAERTPNAALPQPDAEFARLRLFGAMSQFLRRAAGRPGVLLVIDDLHWADEPSLLLLRSVLQEARSTPLLVLVTARDDEIPPGDARAPILEALRQSPDCDPLPLAGLGTNDVRELLGRLGGNTVPDSFVEQVADGTHGNPFFILETIRHFDEQRSHEGAAWATDVSTRDLAKVEGVRDLLRRRISRLGKKTREALAFAAVIGREFDFDLLQRASGGGDDLVDALDEASDARLIEEVADSRGRYSFGHALTCEALYEEQSAARRAQTHRRVGIAIEGRLRGAGEQSLAALSHHFYAGTRVGADDASVEKAIDYGMRAGCDASRRLAHEEATRHLTRTLGLLDEWRPEDRETRCDLLLELRRAQSASGDAAASDTTALAAATIAEEIDSPERLARAALGDTGGMVQRLAAADSQVRLIERALERVGEEHPRTRSLLLSRLALALYYDPRAERSHRADLAEQATAIARKSKDAEALYWALVARHWSVFGPAAAAEQGPIVDELFSLATDLGDKELLVRARGYRVGALFHNGDVGAAVEETNAVADLADAVCSPLFQWTALAFRASLALLEGRVAEAEKLSSEALDLGQRSGEESAFLVFVCQTGAQRWTRCQLSELESLMEDLIGRTPFPLVSAVHAVTARERGDRELAATRLNALAASEFRDVPEDNMWLGTLALIAHVASFVGDAPVVRKLYDLLAPYEGDFVIVGNATVCLGSVDRPLGLLAAALGEKTADAHFETALAKERAAGMSAWAAHTQFEYAGTLIERGRKKDLAKAERLLGEAEEIATTLELPSFVEAINARAVRTS